MKFDWNEIFKNAHLHSWPTASLTISKANPSNKRSPYNDDKKEILEVAKKYGYEKISDTTVVCFLNKNIKGQAY